LTLIIRVIKIDSIKTISNNVNKYNNLPFICKITGKLTIM